MALDIAYAIETYGPLVGVLAVLLYDSIAIKRKLIESNTRLATLIEGCPKRK